MVDDFSVEVLVPAPEGAVTVVLLLDELFSAGGFTMVVLFFSTG